MAGNPSPGLGAPRPAETPLQILKLEPGFAVTLRILTRVEEFVKGLFTHWQKRSHYCKGQDCPPNLHRLDLVWKGYLLVETYNQKTNRWNPHCLEVTEQLELDMRDVVQRGQVWEVWREVNGKGKKAPWRGQHQEDRPEHTFPPEFDLVPHLFSVYHGCRVVLKHKNPMPKRIMVTPSVGDPPAKVAAELAELEKAKVPYNGPRLSDRFGKMPNGHFSTKGNGEPEKPV